jgi:hypothetical protein
MKCKGYYCKEVQGIPVQGVHGIPAEGVGSAREYYRVISVRKYKGYQCKECMGYQRKE